MNHQINRAYARGITALELLISLACLLVLVGFSAPPMGFMSARSDMNSAVRNLEDSIDAARQAARAYHSDIALHLHTGPDHQDSLSYSVPSLIKSTDMIESGLLDYSFPESVHVMADRETIRFDLYGAVYSPAEIVLISTADEDLVERINVQ